MLYDLARISSCSLGYCRGISHFVLAAVNDMRSQYITISVWYLIGYALKSAPDQGRSLRQRSPSIACSFFLGSPR
jgi:hypothetical protein